MPKQIRPPLLPRPDRSYPLKTAVFQVHAQNLRSCPNLFFLDIAGESNYLIINLILFLIRNMAFYR